MRARQVADKCLVGADILSVQGGSGFNCRGRTISAEGVKQVIGRAVVDEGFRMLLFDKPGEALRSFDLTHDEYARLQTIPGTSKTQSPAKENSVSPERAWSAMM